jgi:hypothetical protein
MGAAALVLVAISEQLNTSIREVHERAIPVVSGLVDKKGAPRELALACASSMMRRLTVENPDVVGGLEEGAFAEGRLWCDMLIAADVDRTQALRTRHRCRLALDDPRAAEDWEASITAYRYVVQPGWYGNDSMGYESVEEEEAHTFAIAAKAYLGRAQTADAAERAELLRKADDLSSRAVSAVEDKVGSMLQEEGSDALTFRDKDFPAIFEARARVLEKMGRPTEALAAYRTCAAVVCAARGPEWAERIAHDIARLEGATLT